MNENPAFDDGSAAQVLPPETPQRLETLRPASVQPVPTNPSEMLYLAMSRGSSMEELQKFMDLRDRWEATEARKAFVAAMSRFKAHDIVVSKDKANLQYSSRYTTLGNLVGTVTPFLSKEELSAKWDIEQGTGKVKVTCTITHSLGHSESVWMEAPPDNSGTKNPIQQIKSTITYLKACTFESICGLASTDANLDDDGNGSHHRPSPKNASGEFSDEALAEALKSIASAKTMPELTGAFNTAFSAAQKAKIRHAQDALLEAQRKRQAELKTSKYEGAK